MSLSVKQRVEAFELEWRIRKAFLLLRQASVQEIKAHRYEIMHCYGVTEEELEQYGSKERVQ